MTKSSKEQRKNELDLIPKLVKFGLTRLESSIYVALLSSGSLSAKTLAEALNLLPNTIYRAVKKLNTYRLISTIRGRPVTYKILPLQPALSNLIQSKEQELRDSADFISGFAKRTNQRSDETKIDFIDGKFELYRKGEDGAKRCRKELLIISIGQSIPADLLKATHGAHLRGVNIKMIAHKYDEENRHILDNFKKNGYEIRHYPDWGFHLSIYDGESALLMINNPHNTEERIGIEIFSKGFTKALRDYFFSVWEKAIPV